MNNSFPSNITFNDTFYYPASVDNIRRVCIGLWAIIVTFGLFGNCLTIAVLVSPKLNNSSTTFYLTALAFIDILYLIFSLGGQMFNFAFLFPKTIRQEHPLACISLNIIRYTLTYISVWLLVSVAIDRMIWVIFPFRAKMICTRQIAKIIVAILFVVFILIDIHFVWTLEFQYNVDGLNRCNIRNYFQNGFPYIDLTLIMGLPFIIMSGANILIISKLREMEQIRKRMKSTNRNQSTAIIANSTAISQIDNQKNVKSQKEDEIIPFEVTKRSTRRRSRDKQTTSLTKMLLSVNIFFLVSTTPLLSYNILFFVPHINTLMLQFESRLHGLIFGLERILYTLWYLNFAVHFLLYCMSGPKFRQEAIRLLYKFCCFCKCAALIRLVNIENRSTNNMNDSQYLKTFCFTEENKYVKDYALTPNKQVATLTMSGDQEKQVELIHETNM